MGGIGPSGFSGCVIIVGLLIPHQRMVDTVFLVSCLLLTSLLGQLVTTPLTNFARAATTFSEHAKQSTHLKAVASMAEAEYRFKHSALSIDQQLSSQASQVMSQNKAKLISIMKTVVLCAKQNIALSC